MAGMLPGVECARRRRLYNNTDRSDSPTDDMQCHSYTRFSLFYPSNFESLMLSPTLKAQQRSLLNHANLDNNLGGQAREAKQRLDKRFRAHWKLDNPKRKGLFGGLLCLQLR